MSPTIKRVRKAVIPAAGLGTRFLPATKSTPKEVLPVVDKPAIHYVRQRDPLGLGHAVSVAREHVGEEPFAVLLPDDIMTDNSALLSSMLDVHERYGRSVLALLEVSPEEISSYGCVDARTRDG